MKIESGVSTVDSISFRNGSIAVEARYVADGSINVKNYFIQDSKSKIITPFNIINFFALITLILNIGIYFLDLPKMINVIPIIIAGIFQIAILVSHHKKPEILRNHSVEHKIISAVNSYSRMTTMNDIKKAPKLAKECGTSVFMIYIAYKIVALIISIKFNIIVPEIIVYSIYRSTFLLFPIYYIGYLVQIFEFKEPEERNYKLGKAALDAFIEITDKVKTLSFEKANFEVIEEKEPEDYKVDKEDVKVTALIKKAQVLYEEQIIELMEKEEIESKMKKVVKKKNQSKKIIKRST